MDRVLKFGEYNKCGSQAEEIIEMMFNPILNESSVDDNTVKKILKSLSNDLKFNFGLVSTFGTGITLMYPIVEKLIRNGSLKIEMSVENLILLSITTISITYLEETKNQIGSDVTGDGKKSLVTRKDAQTMLEELKMRGIGNGLVRKFVLAFQSIGKFITIIFRNTPYVINGIINMFVYASLAMPVMNAISSFIGKYDITLENITGNLMSVGLGMGAILAKQGVNWLIDKLKKLLNIKGIGDDLMSVASINAYDIVDGETNKDNLSKTSLIKEQ